MLPLPPGASTGPLIEISGKHLARRLVLDHRVRRASTGPLIEISGKRRPTGTRGDPRDPVASTGPLIEISGKLLGDEYDAWMDAGLQRGR